MATFTQYSIWLKGSGKQLVATSLEGLLDRAAEVFDTDVPVFVKEELPQLEIRREVVTRLPLTAEEQKELDALCAEALEQYIKDWGEVGLNDLI